MTEAIFASEFLIWCVIQGEVVYVMSNFATKNTKFEGPSSYFLMGYLILHPVDNWVINALSYKYSQSNIMESNS